MSNTALYHKSLSLTEALMNYRHQPIYRRLRRLGKRESMLYPGRAAAPRRWQEPVAGSDRARPATGNSLACRINFWPQPAEHRAFPRRRL